MKKLTLWNLPPPPSVYWQDCVYILHGKYFPLNFPSTRTLSYFHIASLRHLTNPPTCLVYAQIFFVKFHVTNIFWPWRNYGKRDTTNHLDKRLNANFSFEKKFAKEKVKGFSVAMYGPKTYINITTSAIAIAITSLQVKNAKLLHISCRIMLVMLLIAD